jgi:hypothetical protein
MRRRRPGRARVVALDGGTLGRSFDPLHDRAAAHVLSASAGEAALIPAHREVRDAPGEVPAVPALIEAPGARGALFTARTRATVKKSCAGAARASAARTGNALLVRLKANHSPACLGRSCGRAPRGTRSAGTRDGRPPPTWSPGAPPRRGLRGRRPAGSRPGGSG